MLWKKLTTLYGNLVQPLRVGKCAVIRSGGQTIRTSQVVAIMEISPEQVSYETMNTKYTLLNPAMAQVNAIPPVMSAAA